MQNYELTIVLRGNASSTKKKTVTEKVEIIIKTLEGKIGKVEEWGKIDLAYIIKGETSGIFMYFILELDAKGARVLPEKIKMEDDIIRYLFVRAGE